ncbi:MAG TPA: hypothetical protein VGI99_11010 [Gemmataceae bacterium]
MNVALVAMLGLSLGQPAPAAAADYHPFTTHKIKFPIGLSPEKAKNIRQVELHVSNDGGQVWQRVAVAPPTQPFFEFKAPADGRYWFQVRTEDMKGHKEPENLVGETPAMKVLFDTKPPVVTMTNATWKGDFVTVQWRIDDQFPNGDTTRVYIRRAGTQDGWKPVLVPANSPNGVQFPPGVAESIVVRVETMDLVGHKGEVLKEIACPKQLVASTSLASPAEATPASGILPPVNVAVAAGGPVAPAAPPIIPPPNLTPIVPPMPVPPVVAPMTPVVPPMTPVAHATGSPSVPPMVIPPVAYATGSPGEIHVPTHSHHAPIPTFDPRTTVTPAGVAPPSEPVIEASRAQVMNALRFDLNYQVEQRGPSGISRVDLWVTRDDGKSWIWWSKHDGRDAALKVNLNTTANSQPEGLYGFRLVPVSGAGLSEAVPTTGDAPDMRVIVDISAPTLKIFPAVADANSPDALVLQWEATDKNFGDDPITLEWCETAGGPWRPVAAVASELPGGLVTAKRLPNTGRFSWRVPAGLPPRVFLKVTAKDAAGNTTEQVTREPILVDLTKPRAKITSIGANR